MALLFGLVSLFFTFFLTVWNAFYYGIMTFYPLQVILDVVYNHTNEADDENPYTTSFRGIDNKVIWHFYWEILLVLYNCFFLFCNIMRCTYGLSTLF